MKSPLHVRLCQLNPTIGDIAGNTSLILSALQSAEKAGADLLILPELCVCGYSPMDLLERSSFVEAIDQANQKIIESTGSTALIFGTVTTNSAAGCSFFNTALMAEGGSPIAEIHKTLLPTYDVFDEDRYFEQNDTFDCIEWHGHKLGITICEDMWGNDSSVQYHTYKVDPVQELVKKGADVLINLSASPFTVSKSTEREQMLKARASGIQRPIFYVNQVGANTELISDGDSMVLDAEEQVIARAPLFEAACINVKWDKNNSLESVDKAEVVSPPSRMARIFEALRHGLKDYHVKTGITNEVVIGLSGGLDSTLVACIAAEALGAENVMGIAMPSEFSTQGSLTDAEKLASNLDIELHEIPIKTLYNDYLDALAPLFGGTSFGVTEENLQSRARGVLLMAVSNKFNRLVLNTGNKSELACGYCTLYGDMNGALAVLSDLYKTEVFELAQWLNESYYQSEVIPVTVLEKPPSAELRPGQKDSDSLPEYEELDQILSLYIEQNYAADDIEAEGFDSDIVSKIINLVDRNVYKRRQAPPGLKIHAKAFGSGRRWPVVFQKTENNHH